MLDLADDWVWDFWTCRDGAATHLFFLHAPRALVDPDLRHVNARVGHAVSEDLVAWTLLPDALAPQPAPAFDDLACWTGSVVRGDDRWWLFTSGITRTEGPGVQRIGVSWSPDLVTWTRTDVVLEADPRWYRRDDEVHWRDPCVLRSDDGLWHMLVTAKVGDGPGGGVVGHATSSDLVAWQVGPPLSGATGRFDQLEVIRVVEVDGRSALLFSCLATEMPDAAPGAGGVWSVPFPGPGRPIDVGAAVRLVGEDQYVGDVVQGVDGPVFLAFRNAGADGRFVGGVTDPVPVGWRPDGRGLQTFT